MEDKMTRQVRVDPYLRMVSQSEPYAVAFSRSDLGPRFIPHHTAPTEKRANEIFDAYLGLFTQRQSEGGLQRPVHLKLLRRGPEYTIWDQCQAEVLKQELLK